MENEILGSDKRISSAENSSAEKVDEMNQLAAMLLEKGDGSGLKGLTEQIIYSAKQIGYEKGLALGFVHAGMYASMQRNFADAARHYKEAISIRKLLHDQEGLAIVFAKLGSVFLHDGKYTEALQYYNLAIEIREAQNEERSVADLYTNTAIIYGLQGNHLLSLKSHFKALSIYEKLKDSSRIAGSCSNIGIIYIEQRNYDDALKMFERALLIREQTQDDKDISIQLNNIGYVYQEQGKLDEALVYHQRALVLREKLGDEAKLAVTYSNLGNVYKIQSKLNIAMDYYNRALVVFEAMNEKRGLVQSYNNLGELHFELGQFTEAHRYLHKAIQLAEEIGLKNQLRMALEFSSQVFAAEEKYREAYDLQKRYMLLDKELSNTETSMQMAQMSTKYEIEQKVREAELERVKNAELTRAFNQLEIEKKRSEELLLNILPEEISEELKQYGKTKARSYASATVLFADIKSFTKISEQFTAEEIVNGIDEYFEAFDKLMDKHSVEKIKTIGDAYLCVCGVPVPDPLHAEKMVRVAKDFVEVVLALKQKREGEGKHSFDFRIGVHSGPIVAGVVGIKKFAYDIWGDTVNTASRMQSNSEPNRINISETTFQLVKDIFSCTYRGEIEAKNKGALKMYFVN